MTKRLERKYRLLRFYQEDFFGELLLKDPFSLSNLEHNFKLIKINKFLYDFTENKVDFWNYIKKHKKKEDFFFRTDVVKPRKRRRFLNEFATRLKNRHKLRTFASQMNVRQLRSYIKKASTGGFFYLNFLRLLEGRLDFVILRMNLVDSSRELRQLINHGNFLINGKVAVFPNQQIGIYDVVSVKNKGFFRKKILDRFFQKKVVLSVPRFLEVNYRIMCCTFLMTPKLKHVVYPSKKLRGVSVATLGKRFGVGC